MDTPAFFDNYLYFLRKSLKKFHGNFLCQPYAVRGKIEGVTGLCHTPGGNLIDNRLSMPLSYGKGGVHISGKMDVEPAFGDQADFLNRSGIFLPGTVPENRRRHGLRQIYIHGNGVALAGPDQCMVFIVSIALFAVGADDFVQQFLGEGGFPGSPNPPDQRIYVGPPVFVQGNADDFRLMAQDQADIAADGSQIYGDHFLSIDSIGVFYPAMDPKSSIPVKHSGAYESTATATIQPVVQCILRPFIV